MAGDESVESDYIDSLTGLSEPTNNLMFTTSETKLTIDETGLSQMGNSNINIQMTPQTKRMLNSGGSGKRSVSETKKKYVAAKQGWKCNGCGEQLNHTFQVDHKIDLQFGGTNNVENLAALCNNCHAMKTASNNL